METVLMLPSPYLLLKSLHILVQCLSLSAIIIVSFKFLNKMRYSKSSNRVIPGPQVPFYSFFGMFGALPSRSTMKRLGLPTTACLENLICGMASIFRNEKIISFSAGLQNWILLTKAESVQEFLCSDALVTKPHLEILITFFGNVLLTSIGPKWKKRKKLIQPMFHYDVLKDLVPTFDKHSKVLVDILKRKHHQNWIDIVEPVNLCTMDIICESFLGINVDAQSNKDSKFLNAIVRSTQTLIERVINPLLKFEIIFMFSAIGRQFKKNMRYIREFAEKVIQEKKAKYLQEENGKCSVECKTKTKNLMNILLNSCVNNKDMSEKEMRDELIGFIFGGSDSTGVGVAWALYLIGLHTETQSKIHEELDIIFGDNHNRSVTADDLKEMHYLECVLKESLRIYPPFPYNPKYVLQDFDLCGYKIKKGTIILVDTYDLHRNPEVFPNPEKFDPDRFLPENSVGRSSFAYIPFSAGNRKCMGQRFAMMEEKTVIANVLRNFSLKSLEHRDKICRSFEFVSRPSQPLKLKFTPRKTCADLQKYSCFKTADKL